MKNYAFLIFATFASMICMGQSSTFQKIFSTDLYTVDGTASYHDYDTATPSPSQIICFSSQIGTPGKFDIALLKIDSSGAVLANNILTKDPAYHDWVKAFIKLDGSYYMTGSSRAFDTSASHYESSYLIKFDENLNLRSQTNYVFPDREIFAQSVAATSDHKILISGLTVHNSNWSFFLMKTDTMGNLIWFKQYAQPIDAAVVSELSNGDIMVAGSYAYGFQFIQPVACRFDSHGNLIWARIYIFATGTFDNQNSTLEFIHDFGNGNIILAGRTDFSGVGAIGFMDSYVLKITDLGNVVWAKTYGGFQNDWPYDYTITPNDNLIISGSTSSFFNFSNYGFALSVDSSGSVINTTAFGDTIMQEQITLTGFRQLNTTRNMVFGMKDNSGLYNLYVSDFSQNSTAHCPLYPVSFQVADASTYPQWNFTFAADSSISPYGNDNSFLNYSGINDSILCADITSVDENSFNRSEVVTILTNPVTDHLKIHLHNNESQDVVANIFNLIGEIILNVKMEKGINTIDVSALHNGIYLFNWHAGENSGSKNLFIIR